MRPGIPFATLIFSIAILATGTASASELGPSPLPPGITVEHTMAPELIVFSQSTSMAVVAGASISCNINRSHANNGYLRRFDPDGMFGVTDVFILRSVDFGVEFADAAGADQPVIVNVYTIASGAPLQYANLNLIASKNLALVDQQLTLVTVLFEEDVEVNDPVANDLVVEVFTPNGQAAGDIFFIGSNSLGQTGASYLAAPACGAPEPRTTISLGFPGMQIVLVATVEIPVQVETVSWGATKAIYR